MPEPGPPNHEPAPNTPENGVPIPLAPDEQQRISAEHGEQDSRWSHDKAATVSAGADLLQETHKGKRLLGMTNYEVGEKQVQEKVRQLVEERTEHMNPEEVEEYTREITRLIEEDLQEFRGRVAADVEKRTKIPETLYNTNPEMFSRMPTSEFIAIVKNLESLERDAQDIENSIFDTDECIRKLNNDISKERTPSWQHVGDMLMNIAHGFVGTPEEANEKFNTYDAKLKAVTENFYDKTPRQIMDEYVKIFTELAAVLRTNRDEIQSRIDEFLTQYKPTTQVSKPETE